MLKTLFFKLGSPKFWVPYMFLLTLTCLFSLPIILVLLTCGVLTLSIILKILLIELTMLYMSFGSFLCIYVVKKTLESDKKWY